jgi:hypothetical protein
LPEYQLEHELCNVVRDRTNPVSGTLIQTSVRRDENSSRSNSIARTPIKDLLSSPVEEPAAMFSLLRPRDSPAEQDRQAQHALAEEDIGRILQVFKIGDLSDDRDLILSDNSLIKPAACIAAVKEEWKSSTRKGISRATRLAALQRKKRSITSRAENKNNDALERSKSKRNLAA